MRIALHHTSPVGVRAGRILLGERELTALGILDSRKKHTDPRVETVEDLADYDVLVADDLHDAAEMAEEALDAGVHCVLWADMAEARLASAAEGLGEAFTAAGRSLIIGANLATGIAPALASHELARVETVLDVMVAWTEPGSPLRRGEAVPFPDPVGARWGRVRPSASSHRAVVVPVGGEWAGALARITAGTIDGVYTRIVGLADHAEHVEALALAAGAMAVGDGVWPPGLHSAGGGRESYLARALRAGLDIATYTEQVSKTRDPRR